MNETLNETLLVGAAAVTGVLIFALQIYYVWKMVVSFRRKGVRRWPPILAFSFWLLQWPFAILSAAGCLGGGCGDPKRNWLELLGVLAYNLTAGYWLWRRPAVKVTQ